MTMSESNTDPTKDPLHGYWSGPATPIGEAEVIRKIRAWLLGRIDVGKDTIASFDRGEWRGS
jgi:hypothetical protein